MKLGKLVVTYSRSDLALVALIGAVVAGWAALALGSVSLGALLACESAFFTSYMVGSLLAGWGAISAGLLFDLPLRLLLGYGVVNTALLVLAWLSPLGTVANFVVLAALSVVLFLGAGKPELAPANRASVWAVCLALVATTLWCQDSIRPIQHDGAQVVFKPWVDGFYHAVHVRLFAGAHGASTIEDFRLAGMPARPYHYGMYMLPAFVKQASGIPAYAAFAGVLAPVGVFFTALAAYAFFGSLGGAWAGFAAAAALLLLPDGAQQGMQNPFMSYHWLTQISPSATYGVSLLATGWLFVIQGCTQARRLQLLAGWLLAAVSAFYKLHFVIASALLLLLVPALFFCGLRVRQRVAYGGAACGLYVLGLFCVQKVPGVPLIRFDGSSVGEVLRLIESFALPGSLREIVARHTGVKVSWVSNLLFGVPYVLSTIFGLILLPFAFLQVRMRRRLPALYGVFPLALALNFLIMFFGLALDFDSSTPDELSHRPLMVVYFFLVGWVGSALALWLPARRSVAVAAALGIAALSILVPAHFGQGVQKMWAMPKISPVRLPVEVVQVADFIRTHGSADDVFQDSQFDRIYAFAALAERRTFVAHTMTRIDFRADMVQARSNAIDHFMGIRQPKLVTATARALGFRWFILERGDRVDWPRSIADHPAAEFGPFKVYQF
jgi:hypothetical protein